MARKKIALIGSGMIGGFLAYLANLRNLGEVVLFDLLDGLPQGKSLDISQASFAENVDMFCSGSNDYSVIAGADVCVITAGLARKPGMTREDLIEKNLTVIREVAEGIRRYAPDAFVICVTNPLDAMVWALQKFSKLPHNRCVGMSGVLDSARFCYFLSQELNVSAQDVSTMVIGAHNDTMIPLTRYSSVGGIPLEEFVKMGLITKTRLQEIVDRTRTGGLEIVSFLKTGSAYFAPAASVISMVEAYINDRKKIVSASVFLSGQYSLHDMYLGVPVVIGKNGVEKVLELALNEEEKDMFDQSIKTIKDLYDTCVKISPDLS